jgi:hypothetical protein
MVSAEVVFRRIFCGALLLATFVAGKVIGPFTGTTCASNGFHDTRSMTISPRSWKDLYAFVWPYRREREYRRRMQREFNCEISGIDDGIRISP